MTEIKKTAGMMIIGERMHSVNIDARFTHDELGETLSLACGNVMLQVRFEDIEPMIKKAREI